jgi:hypothetical protein
MRVRAISLLATAFLLAAPSIATAQENVPDELKELESKITNQLKTEDWDQESIRFIGALWDDYKQTWVANKQPMSTSASAATMPDVEAYDDYLGKYRRPGAPADVSFLEVEKLASGRYVVKLEDHVIPAIAVNKSLYFTTGDVVHDSQLPSLAEKDYAGLELILIRRINGQFVMADEGAMRGPRLDPALMERMKLEKVAP